MTEGVVRVKERCSGTDRARGVYAGAFGARAGVEEASRRQWAGVLMAVEEEWWLQRVRMRSLVLESWSMGGRCVQKERARARTDGGGRSEGAVVLQVVDGSDDVCVVEMAMQVGAGMQAGGREAAGYYYCWTAGLLDKFGACQDGVCMALAMNE